MHGCIPELNVLYAIEFALAIKEFKKLSLAASPIPSSPLVLVSKELSLWLLFCLHSLISLLLAVYTYLKNLYHNCKHPHLKTRITMFSYRIDERATTWQAIKHCFLKVDNTVGWSGCWNWQKIHRVNIYYCSNGTLSMPCFPEKYPPTPILHAREKNAKQISHLQFVFWVVPIVVSNCKPLKMHQGFRASPVICIDRTWSA